MTALAPGAPAVPPPPPGPGVQPPFVAPPTDGASKRRWLAIGLSAGALVLVCLAGATGIGGLLVLSARVLQDEARASVTAYLTALRDRDYDEAYDLLCDPLQVNTSRREFERASRATPPVVGFEVTDVDFADDIQVQTTITYGDGSVRTVVFVMYQDPNTAAVEVCGEAD